MGDFNTCFVNTVRIFRVSGQLFTCMLTVVLYSPLPSQSIFQVDNLQQSGIDMSCKHIFINAGISLFAFSGITSSAMTRLDQNAMLMDIKALSIFLAVQSIHPSQCFPRKTRRLQLFHFVMSRGQQVTSNRCQTKQCHFVQGLNCPCFLYLDQGEVCHSCFK